MYLYKIQYIFVLLSYCFAINKQINAFLNYCLNVSSNKFWSLGQNT